MRLQPVTITALAPWGRAYLVISLLIYGWKATFAHHVGLFTIFWAFRSPYFLTELPGAIAFGLWTDITNPLANAVFASNQLVYPAIPSPVVFGIGLLLLVAAQILLILGVVRRVVRFRKSDATPAHLIEVQLLHVPAWYTPLVMTGCIIAVFAILQTLFNLILPPTISRYSNPTIEQDTTRYFIVYVGIFMAVCGLLWAERFSNGALDVLAGAFQSQPLTGDDPLAARVYALAERLGLPRPVVATMPHMNAYAVGSSRQNAAVVLGRPLLAKLSDEEVDAVIGHELGHIVSTDMRRMQLAMGYETMFSISLNAAAQQSGRRHTFILAQLLRFFVLAIARLATRAISRSREYHADAMGAAVTSPAAMISALQKLDASHTPASQAEQDYGYFMFRAAALSSTHPSTERRIAALQSEEFRIFLPSSRVPGTVIPTPPNLFFCFGSKVWRGIFQAVRIATGVWTSVVTAVLTAGSWVGRGFIALARALRRNLAIVSAIAAIGCGGAITYFSWNIYRTNHELMKNFKAENRPSAIDSSKNIVSPIVAYHTGQIKVEDDDKFRTPISVCNRTSSAISGIIISRSYQNDPSTWDYDTFKIESGDCHNTRMLGEFFYYNSTDADVIDEPSEVRRFCLPDRVLTGSLTFAQCAVDRNSKVVLARKKRLSTKNDSPLIFVPATRL